MRLWFWLVEIPAFIVTAWLWVYQLFLLVASIVLFSMMLTVLVLYWGFGIRWGW